MFRTILARPSSSRSGPCWPRATRALLLLLLAAPALAQPMGDPVWVPLDDMPDGTPAEIRVLPEGSNTMRTSVEVTIHGFWKQDVVGPDGETYQRLDFPGLHEVTQPGAPELPVARIPLAMATDAEQASFIGAEVLSQDFVSELLVHPTPIPGEDEEFDPHWEPGPGDPFGSDEEWTLDAEIYASTEPWPQAPGEDAMVASAIGPVMGTTVIAYPVQWDPAANRLIVQTQALYEWSHAGSVGDGLVVTKVKDKLYSKMFYNWDQSGVLYPIEPLVYQGRYLIIASPFWFDTLEPFVAMKKVQGYEVTVDSALADVASIRQAIADWYAAGDPGMDHFCLLVGDTQLVPQQLVTANGAEVWTDDVYGCIGSIDQSKEVHVGRLSVDSEDDLEAQLDKIIAYQTSPVPGARYDTALLVAHEEDYPDKYSASHTKVLTASYSKPPTFMASYGGTGGTNQQVFNFITAGQLGDGLGLVAYRGHGSTSAWTGWNLAEENWHSNNVIMLNNPVHPIVWAITCTNANIDWGWGTTSDSIAEVWMEASQGAVASYGATRTTSTTPNHHLNETLFKVVWDQGITTHGMAIAAAEASVWSGWPGHKNPWAYLLLGDPSMTIRRDAAFELVFAALPETLSVDQSGGELSLQALTPGGGAPSFGLLSWTKASFFTKSSDEMLGAIWLGEDSGMGTLPLHLATPGMLTVMARDEDGNSVCREIEVTMGAAWTDLGEALPGEDGAPRMAGLGTLEPGSEVSLLLADAPPSSTAWVGYGASAASTPLLGGVLVPEIAGPGGGVMPVPVDEAGNLRIDAHWPANAPAGAELVLQAWCPDPTGPQGFVASNAIMGTGS